MNAKFCKVDATEITSEFARPNRVALHWRLSMESKGGKLQNLEAVTNPSDIPMEP